MVQRTCLMVILLLQIPLGYAATDWDVTMSVNPHSGNAPLTITVQMDVQESAPTTYTVSATAGSGGAISPTNINVTQDATTRFTVRPQEGYGIKSISGCGGTLNGTTYTTAKIISDCSVNADFSSTDGKIITNILSGSKGKSVELQSDGKIVVFAYAGTRDNATFLVVRYNIDGSLDTTFGNGGWSTSNYYGAIAQGLTIQPDGKILVTGISDGEMALLRYKSDGRIDGNFGENGIVNTDSGDSRFSVYDITYQTDGKIIVIGTTWRSSGLYNWFDMTLYRYASDGLLDTTFNNSGRMSTDILGHASGRAITINPDGKIIAVGSSGDTFRETRYPGHFALLRINENGSLDDSFNNGGKVTTTINGDGDVAVSVARQADGKIIAAGYTNNGSDSDFALVRYGSDGGIDGSFGNSGIITVDINSGSSDSLSDIALQADGKIIIVGTSGGDIVLARYHINGTLDESFGIYGFVTTDILDANDRANGVVVQEDGKIVVVGSCTEGIALLRYNSDGTLDNSFDGDVLK